MRAPKKKKRPDECTRERITKFFDENKIKRGAFLWKDNGGGFQSLVWGLNLTDMAFGKELLGANITESLLTQRLRNKEKNR